MIETFSPDTPVHYVPNQKSAEKRRVWKENMARRLEEAITLGIVRTIDATTYVAVPVRRLPRQRWEFMEMEVMEEDEMTEI